MTNYNLNCLVCGHNVFTGSYKFRGTTLRYQKDYFEYSHCQSCGSLNNITLCRPDYEGYKTGSSISKLKVNRVVKFLKQCGISKKDTILDYGCGNGALIKALIKSGFKKVRGYEPYNKNYKNTLIESEGIKFKVVCLTHVFEHIPDYSIFFQQLEKISEPGTKIITIHPSASRMLPVKINNPFHIFSVHAPFHSVIPSDKSVINLFSQHEFELKKIRRYDIQRSGFKDNSRVNALLARNLGGIKENWLNAPLSKKLSALIKSPLSFVDCMFIRNRDYLTSTLVFEKS